MGDTVLIRPEESQQQLLAVRSFRPSGHPLARSLVRKLGCGWECKGEGESRTLESSGYVSSHGLAASTRTGIKNLVSSMLTQKLHAAVASNLAARDYTLQLETVVSKKACQTAARDAKAADIAPALGFHLDLSSDPATMQRDTATNASPTLNAGLIKADQKSSLNSISKRCDARQLFQ